MAEFDIPCNQFRDHAKRPSKVISLLYCDLMITVRVETNRTKGKEKSLDDYLMRV